MQKDKKDFATSDNIRNYLTQHGIQINDGKKEALGDYRISFLIFSILLFFISCGPENLSPLQQPVLLPQQKATLTLPFLMLIVLTRL